MYTGICFADERRRRRKISAIFKVDNRREVIALLPIMFATTKTAKAVNRNEFHERVWAGTVKTMPNSITNSRARQSIPIPQAIR